MQRAEASLSFFNFVYYRHYRHQPPLHVIERMRDPEWLAAQPQWYFVDSHGFKYWWSDYRGPLPREFSLGQTHTFDLDVAPTSIAKQGLLRLMTEEDTAECTWAVKVNDTPLAPTEFVREPLDHPCTSALGEPNQYACFTCSPSCTADGVNKIEITLRNGQAMTLRYFDVILW